MTDLIKQDFIDRKLAPAIFSTVKWCTVWLVSFFVLIVVSENLGVSSQTSALIITITLVASHFTKYVSYVADSDTDFRSQRVWSIANLPKTRLFFSSILLIVIGAVIVFPNYGSQLGEQFNAADVVEFATHSWNNWYIVLLLFLLQMVFSWPENVVLSGQTV